MSQAGYTPIQLYHSTTAAATPSGSNMVVGELALNVTDKTLYAFDGTDVFLLAQAGAVNLANNLTGGAKGSIPYQNALDDTVFLAPGAAGYVLQTNGAGAAPTWNPVEGYSGGTVTEVNGVGSVNGITLSGTVNGYGDLTLGGTLSGVDLTTQVTGTLPFANGGTNAITRQGAINALANAVTLGHYLRGDGTDVVMSAIQAADVPTLNQNTTGSAGSVVTTNFTIEQSSGKLVFKYGTTTIGSLDSSGNFIVIGNVTGYGTP
jgi:hypothetical protein